MKALFYVFIFLGALLISRAGRTDPAPSSQPSAGMGSVELHAHLFMKEGMTWGFSGDFFGPLKAHDYKDGFSSQANPATLEKSGLSIVVATLYAHPLFVMSLRDSIREQIGMARKFVLSEPDWVIATEPEQARKALAEGKHVMILALEGASGILETEQDMREFVDEGGIRIVTPLHLIDDEFGGVAFLRGTHVLANPLTWLFELFSPKHDESGVMVNKKGLTDQGRALIQKLMRHHVWIDLAHASDASTQDIMAMIAPEHLPLLYTHTVLRKYHHAERAISDEEIAKVAQSGGIIGLMPSEQYLAGAPRTAGCPSALSALVLEYEDLVKILGPDAVTMGSDYNGAVHHLAPGCNSGTSIDREGLWNMGQIPELWQAMKNLGAPVPEPLTKQADRFIATWAKVFEQR